PPSFILKRFRSFLTGVGKFFVIIFAFNFPLCFLKEEKSCTSNILKILPGKSRFTFCEVYKCVCWANLCNRKEEAIDKNAPADRKSTRLNSSHVSISYAVFCLKKKKKKKRTEIEVIQSQQ